MVHRKILSVPKTWHFRSSSSRFPRPLMSTTEVLFIFKTFSFSRLIWRRLVSAHFEAPSKNDISHFLILPMTAKKEEWQLCPTGHFVILKPQNRRLTFLDYIKFVSWQISRFKKTVEGSVRSGQPQFELDTHAYIPILASHKEKKKSFANLQGEKVSIKKVSPTACILLTAFRSFSLFPIWHPSIALKNIFGKKKASVMAGKFK